MMRQERKIIHSESELYSFIHLLERSKNIKTSSAVISDLIYQVRRNGRAEVIWMETDPLNSAGGPGGFLGRDDSSSMHNMQHSQLRRHPFESSQNVQRMIERDESLRVKEMNDSRKQKQEIEQKQILLLL